MNAPTRQNPFPGPRPYERDAAADFKGREREIRELRALIASRGVVVVVGPSGCGKSSLLRAGVRPELEQSEYEVLPIARVGEALRGTREGAPTSDATDPSVFERNVSSYLGDAARGAGLLPALAARPRTVAADGAAMPRVLIIDQCEELFTTHLTAWRERPAFLRTVLAANDGAIDTRMVLVLRAEYLSAFAALLARLGDDTSARARAVTYYHVERLTQQAAAQVMTTLLRRDFPTFPDDGGRSLARQMSREFVRLPDGTRAEAEGEFVEPLYLQIVCRALWDKLAQGDARPDDASLLLGTDVDVELQGFVQRALDTVARDRQVNAGRLRGWIEDELITKAGTRDSVIREATETAGMPNAVVEALERNRILRSEERAAGFWYELAHDRLVPAVQALGVAARKAREVRVQRYIQTVVFVFFAAAMAGTLWNRMAMRRGEIPAVAAPAVAVASAKKAEEYVETSPEIASAWIREALQLGNDPRVDSIARMIAERSLVSQPVLALTQVPAVAVAVGSDSLVAVGTGDGRLWVLNALASRAPLDSAVDAAARANDERFRADPMRRYDADVRGVVPGWSGGVVGLGYAPGANQVAVAGRDGRVSLITRPEWKRERDFKLTLQLSALAVTPSADEIAVGAVDGTLVRLGADGRERRARLPSERAVQWLGFGRNTELLAVDSDGGVFAWGAPSAAVRLLWSPPGTPSASAPARATRSPDGSELVIAHAGVLHRVRLATGGATAPAMPPPITCEGLQNDAVTALSYSRSGASVIVGTASGRLHVWSVRRQRCDWSAPGPRAEVRAITPLAEGRPVVTLGANREIRIWFQPPTAREVQATVAAWRTAPAATRRADSTQRSAK